MEKTLGTDASGNPILADVGIFLRDKLKAAIKVWVELCFACACCLIHAAQTPDASLQHVCCGMASTLLLGCLLGSCRTICGVEESGHSNGIAHKALLKLLC